MAAIQKETEESSLSSSELGYTGPTGTDSSRCSKRARKFPGLASDWKLRHLSEIGLYYDDSPTDIKKYMSVVKDSYRIKSVGEGVVDMPEISKKLLQLTKDWWKFSFNFDIDEEENTLELVENGIEKAVSAVKEFQEENSSIVKGLQQDQQKEQIDLNCIQAYSVWRMNLLEFWKYFSMLLARWWKPFQREGKYTYLFMGFSKICLLYPEPGETYTEDLQIKDITVRGRPDVRFMAFPAASLGGKLSASPRGDDLQLIIVTEVKHYDAFRGSFNAETFTFENISKEVLGQHGIKLLMERKCSFFFPGVVGLLCIGTKVIFTYVYVKKSHYEKILTKGVVEKTTKASIMYTRPYDYMDADERVEILETLYWFGFVQSSASPFSMK